MPVTGAAIALIIIVSLFGSSGDKKPASAIAPRRTVAEASDAPVDVTPEPTAAPTPEPTIAPTPTPVYVAPHQAAVVAQPAPVSTPYVAPPAATAVAASSGCAASYPDFCIPPPPPDLNCKDVAPHHNFRVLWNVADPDPHHFDADHDGVGCES